MITEVKPAAFELLHKMFQKTYDVTFETDLLHTPVDTNLARKELRKLITKLVMDLLNDHSANTIESHIMDMIQLIKKAGYSIGHIHDNWITGTWGVRLSECYELLAMNSYIPVCSIGYKFSFPIDDNTDSVICRVSRITYTTCGVFFDVQPDLYTMNDKLTVMNPFSGDILWNSLYYGRQAKPWFMEYSTIEN